MDRIGGDYGVRIGRGARDTTDRKFRRARGEQMRYSECVEGHVSDVVLQQAALQAMRAVEVSLRSAAYSHFADCLRIST